MVKIKCAALDGGLLQSNRYITPKGSSYNFTRGVFREVADKDDAEHFLAAGGGALFVKETIVSKVKEAVTHSEQKKKEAQKLSEDDVYALNKAEQRKLIQKLGGSMHRIPALEKDRVALILKLQEENI